MKFRVVGVGRSRCGWANEAVADYTRRMRRFGGVDEVAVNMETFRGDVDSVRAVESARILAKVKSRNVLVVLDERGKDMSTKEFAKKIDGLRQRGTVVFAIGGAYGHDKTLRDRADVVIRLSSLVLNHEVARVLLYEQLYRAMSLLAGEPYHHA